MEARSPALGDSPPQLDSIADAVAAVAAGQLVVVVDDTDRENEGDLIMAASKTTPEQMAFMVRHTSGIICAPMTAERAERLNLPPMVANNMDPMRTAFTVSVDYRVGMTTGISAIERTGTMRALAADAALPGDFLRPGHVFPLIARAGGVLTRSGHTEAAIDLARLAGLPPVGVLAEVVNDDGSVKRLAELVSFAREHKLKIVSIEDLIAARVKVERLVQRVLIDQLIFEGLAATIYAYTTPPDPWQHIVAVFGTVGDGIDVPCRIHREQPFKEWFGGGSPWWRGALKAFRTEGRGICVLLRGPDVAAPPQPRGAESGAESGVDGERHASALSRKDRWRDIGAGAQILRDLGVRSIALIAAQERSYIGLAGYGIDLSRTIALPD